MTYKLNVLVGTLNLTRPNSRRLHTGDGFRLWTLTLPRVQPSVVWWYRAQVQVPSTASGFAVAPSEPVHFLSPDVAIYCLIICSIQLLTPNNLRGTRSVRRTADTRSVSAISDVTYSNRTLQSDNYLLTYRYWAWATGHRPRGCDPRSELGLRWSVELRLLGWRTLMTVIWSLQKLSAKKSILTEPSK